MGQEFQSYRDLVVWQKAMALAAECYRKTATFPKSEMYGLTNQVRRSAASVPANIAEGHGRESTGSFIQSLRVAQGSLKELETHVYLAERVDIMPSETMKELLTGCETVGKLLRSLIRSLQAKQANT